MSVKKWYLKAYIYALHIHTLCRKKERVSERERKEKNLWKHENFPLFIFNKLTPDWNMYECLHYATTAKRVFLFEVGKFFDLMTSTQHAYNCLKSNSATLTKIKVGKHHFFLYRTSTSSSSSSIGYGLSNIMWTSLSLYSVAFFSNNWYRM